MSRTLSLTQQGPQADPDPHRLTVGTLVPLPQKPRRPPPSWDGRWLGCGCWLPAPVGWGRALPHELTVRMWCLQTFSEGQAGLVQAQSQSWTEGG